ncbi:FAD-binding oxidoreductase [Sphingomonas sp. PL-96]|uniref:FAD-binding oxidoreductase n=1 Tax=Sphingomonas sp. PL-96 TaxID=2887201 RepID=UPI001E3C1039|nr:FAD-binding oxidoreductase [Sphingomonas sp. PL-96]MCC2976538.1 FAD-binding oxidoreductase [Sphingomonas sp. PL-96]
MSVAVEERASLASRLTEIVGQDNVHTGAAVEARATDVFRAGAMPVAVVRPGSVEALQRVVELAASEGVRFTVRGGGASYTDGYSARDAGQLLIDLGALDRILTINSVDGYVTVEAGVTWAALRDTLAAQDLRTPFWGPFSGLAATVGGSMSQNTISHGSAAYGISADSVLSFDVVTADGSILSTGPAAVGAKPFMRHFGPDLTGLFTGDCGTLGIKARITLPVIARRPTHRPISFAFETFEAMHKSMRLIARERIEDTHFALDAALSQGQIARQERAGATLGMALSIVRSSPSLAAGVRQVAKAALTARRQIGAAKYMTHYIVEGFDDAEVKARLHRIRAINQGLGPEIAATVPAVVRGTPFAPLYNVLGPSGERWVPLHGNLPHSAVPAFHAAYMALLEARAADMKAHGVWCGGMYGAIGSGGFLYEIAIYWPDEITAYHNATVPADYLAGLPRYPANPTARAYVTQLKADLVDLLVAHGAVNFQLGRAYPYAGRLEKAPLGLVKAIKAKLDPEGLVAPGNLGL